MSVHANMIARMHKQAIHITQQPSARHQASNHPSAACSFAVFDNAPIPPNLDRVLHLALARLRHGVPTCTAISSTAAVDALRDAPDVLRALLRISGIAVSLNSALAMPNWMSVGVLMVATGSGRQNALRQEVVRAVPRPPASLSSTLCGRVDTESVDRPATAVKAAVPSEPMCECSSP
ncbi:hypothetical protein FIBSPDRAFT_961074 [Athelia psychrophila]|uniref:Uncharacterized protein n=1 Tax=Athelia psychrophila TaxID=1759441 RepID=A0A166BR32_9AGAM|nr:hypothetical protein FIBSPDRAFT_961074 [Fibularhizoctonia sp. CBS 109695]